MSVDRPFVGGDRIEMAPGTCPACVWGDGPHTCERPEYDESYEASQAILEAPTL